MTIPGPMEFLDALTGHVEGGRTSSADRPIRLATVDPAYDPFVMYPSQTPAARVTFEGETTLTARAYPLAGDFIPRPGQRVYLLPQGNSYVIGGSVNTQTPQGFWQDPDGTDSGVELGGGNYFDTTDGLYLETDATVAGDLQGARFLHAARNLRVPEIQMGSLTLSGPGAGTSISTTVTYPVPWPAGTSPIVLANIAGAPAGTAYAYARVQGVTNTNFVPIVLKSDAARANFASGENFSVHWVALAMPASF